MSLKQNQVMMSRSTRYKFDYSFVSFLTFEHETMFAHTNIAVPPYCLVNNFDVTSVFLSKPAVLHVDGGILRVAHALRAILI